MQRRYLISGVLICDLLWSPSAMVGALMLRYGAHLSHAPRSTLAFSPFLVATWVLWPLLSLVRPLHGFASGLDGSFNRGGLESAAVSHLSLSMIGLSLLLFSGGYIFHSDASRLTLVYFAMLLFAGFTVIRVGAYRLPQSSSRNATYRLVIIWLGRLSRMPARKRQHLGMLGRVRVTLFPDDELTQAAVSNAAAVSIASLNLVDLLCAEHVEEVVLSVPGRVPLPMLVLAAHCQRCGIRVSSVPQLFELYLSRPAWRDRGLIATGLTDTGRVDSDASATLPSARLATNRRLTWKSELDSALGLLLSLIALPLAVPATFVLRLTQHRGFGREFAISGLVSKASKSQEIS